MTLALFPWESAELMAAEDADLVAFQDAAREAWLDDFLADLFEEPAVEAAYVPFQLAPSEYVDCQGTLTDEIGYAETVAPWLY